MLGQDPFPDHDEAFAYIRGEETNKELMDSKFGGEQGRTTSDSSTLAVRKPGDSRKLVDHEKLVTIATN